MHSLDMLRALARYQTHGGYTWAAVMSDGELLCTRCTREHYRQVFRATKDRDAYSAWCLTGLANSGEAESTEHCAHCNVVLWMVEE